MTNEACAGDGRIGNLTKYHILLLAHIIFAIISAVQSIMMEVPATLSEPQTSGSSAIFVLIPLEQSTQWQIARFRGLNRS